MNNLQKLFAENMVKDCAKQIQQLEDELKNPKIRKRNQRLQSIENLKGQIAQCQELLKK